MIVQCIGDSPQIISIVLFFGLDTAPRILLPKLVVIIFIAVDQLQILSFLGLATGNADAETVVLVENDELVVIVGIIRVVRIVRARRISVLFVVRFGCMISHKM